MSQTEYGEHRGISQQRVHTMIKQGKLAGCLKKIGKYKKIDRDMADAALERNLDRVYNRPDPPGKKTSNKPKGKKKPTAEEQCKILTDAGVEMRSLSEAQTIHENFKAYIKEIEYKTKMKELIPADEAEKIMTHIVMTARGRILGIKAKLAPLLKEFVGDPVNFGYLLESIDENIRDILQDMADASKVV